MTDMTDELERLLAAATPRPWKQWPYDTTLIVKNDTMASSKTVADAPLVADAALIVAAINALPELLESAKENAILKRLAPEYYQWPGKTGAELAPEWLQHRLKYGGASVDGDILAVYDWHDRRSLAAPGDYVVDGEKGLYVLVNARTALKGT